MTSTVRGALASLVLLSGTVIPGLGQNLGTGKVTPKLEPIAETRLLMEGLAHANFRGIERNLQKTPIDDQSWVFARGQALLIAETANLLMLRPPKTPTGQPAWFEHAMDLRSQAAILSQQLSKKDAEASKAALQRVANSCNRCHQSFRVQVDITPFVPPEPPAPMRKVSAEVE